MTASNFTDLDQLTNHTLVLILAGGKGSRLHELTEYHAKPRIEFAAGYKIIDFALSNCINSNLRKIGVVTQYKAQSLISHLINGWIGYNQNRGEFIELLPASQQTSMAWYKGTADSLFQNIGYIKSVLPKYVVILSGDHVYQMDYRTMLQKHVSTGAKMTVACIETSICEASGQYGVLNTDDNDRVLSFEEKPQHPKSLKDFPDHVLASMGNYVFDADFLIELLQKDALDSHSSHDFGKDIIPNVLNGNLVQAFRFRDAKTSTIPFWQDVGTLDAYWKSNMAFLHPVPPFQLSDPLWPMRTVSECLPPVRFVTDTNDSSAIVRNSLISNGCTLHPCNINHSSVCENAIVGNGAKVEESVLLPNVSVGDNAVIRRAIIDRATIIPKNMQIGVNPLTDKKRGFRLSKDGIVLVTQSMLDRLSQLNQRPEHRQVYIHSALNAAKQVATISSTNKQYS